MMEQDRKEYLDKDESEKMCSSKIGEAGEMCSPADTDTCGECGCNTTQGYLKVLEFKHSVEFFSFNRIDENRKAKQLITQITVVVALDVGAWNTINPDDESE